MKPNLPEDYNYYEEKPYLTSPKYDKIDLYLFMFFGLCIGFAIGIIMGTFVVGKFFL